MQQEREWSRLKELGGKGCQTKGMMLLEELKWSRREMHVLKDFTSED